jgi:hypothetical protein
MFPKKINFFDNKKSQIENSFINKIFILIFNSITTKK